MRLSIACAVAISVFSCKTADKSGDTAQVKDIESVKKVVVVQGNQPGGEAIAVVRCAAGWVDSSGQTEFAVPWGQVKNATYTELEQRFCTQALGNGGGNGGGGVIPLPVGGGAPVKLGFYNLENGTGCTMLHLTPKTQGGVLRGLTQKCIDDDKVTNLVCGSSGSCNANGIELSYFDDGVIEVSNGGSVLNYKFVNEGDACLSKGGKRFQGHCWVFASAPNLHCNEVCVSKQLVFDESGASKGTNTGFCHELGAKFGMPAKDFNGTGEGPLGCVYCTDQQGGTCASSYVGVFNTGPSTLEGKKAHLRLFCPCR